MGKGSKHRKPQSTPTLVSAQAVSRTASPISAPTAMRAPLARRITLQFASTALGFVFNAANPIGVRFAKSSSGVDLSAGPLTNFTLLSTSTIVAKTTTPVARRTFPSSSVAQPSPTPLPPVKVPPTPVAQTDLHPPPPVAISNLPPQPAPVTAVAPTNPAPIHWRDAKPLAAGGHAVLVDVRPRPVYDAGHIPDAVSLPETSSPAEFAAFLKLLPTNTTLIVYCASGAPKFSGRG